MNEEGELEEKQPLTQPLPPPKQLPLQFLNGNFPSGHIPPSRLSEIDWDYEAMGLSYDQLMEYFDNLKESTA